MKFILISYFYNIILERNSHLYHREHLIYHPNQRDGSSESWWPGVLVRFT